MIDHDEVRRIARLARLERPKEDPQLMDEPTVAALARDLEQILGYVKLLEEIDVDEVPPTAHGVDLPTKLRADAPRPDVAPEQLLNGAPSRSEGAVRVPKIVE